MVGVWFVGVFVLIVQLVEFRGVAGNRRLVRHIRNQTTFGVLWTHFAYHEIKFHLAKSC